MQKTILSLLLIIVISLSITISLTISVEASLQIRAGHLNYQDEKIFLEEGVTIYRDELEINSEEGEVFREEERAFLSGGVTLFDERGTIEGQEMTAWFQEERYEFSNDVILNYSFGDEGEERPFRLESPSLEITGDKGSFRAWGGVIIDYEGRRIKAEEADYHDEDEFLKLTDNVYIEEEEGDWIRSQSAVFYLGEGEGFSADGDVEIELNL